MCGDCGGCGVHLKSPHFVVIWQGILARVTSITPVTLDDIASYFFIEYSRNFRWYWLIQFNSIGSIHERSIFWSLASNLDTTFKASKNLGALPTMTDLRAVCEPMRIELCINFTMLNQTGLCHILCHMIPFCRAKCCLHPWAPNFPVASDQFGHYF